MALLDVLIGQHFDAAVSLKRRLGVRFARFSQIGATYFDRQIVTGTLGNLAGGLLMQLVNSPSSRPPYGHLWSFGCAAIYNGDGTATPVLDSWANKDTDITPLAVDIGTQTLSAGAYGIIKRGTKDDSQELVFMGAGIGGSPGGGAAGWYGNGIDGDVTVPTTSTFQLLYSGGSGGWASNTKRPLFILVSGAYLLTKGPFVPPFIDGSKTYAFLLRDAYFHNLTLASDVVLVPRSTGAGATGTIICCSGTLSGPPTGAGAEIDSSGNINIVIAWAAAHGSIGAGGGGWTFISPWTASGDSPGNYGSLTTPQFGGVNGSQGGALALPPFDETSSVGLKSGAGGGVSPNAGGIGSGLGDPTAHPMNAGPAWMVQACLWGGFRGFDGVKQARGGCGGGGGYLNTNLPTSAFVAGNGGAGGGVILIRAKAVSAGSGLAIKANGGDGLNGWYGTFTSQNNGGGGGGNGGIIACASDSLDPAVTFSVAPGGRGLGSGTGQNGTAAGATGAVYKGTPDSM